MRHAMTVVVALVLTAALPARATPPRRESPARLLASSTTLCMVVPNGGTVLETEISTKLVAWGRLMLAARPDIADLVLEVRRIDPLRTNSEFRETESSGIQYVALVRHRQSGVQVWSTTKGASWTPSDWNGAWAGRQIADEFVRYFDKTVPLVKK